MIFKVPLSGGGLILPLSFPQALSRELRVYWRGGRAGSARTGLTWSPGAMSSFFTALTTVGDHGKTIALTIQTFVRRIMSLLFNTLSRFVIVFLPRSNHPLISWLQSPSAVILEPKKKTSVTISIFSPSLWHAVMGADIMISVFLLNSLKLARSPSSFTLLRGSLAPLGFLPFEWFRPHVWGCWPR